MDATFRRIVVGVDGSAASAAALRWATSLAAHARAEVVAVNAFQNPWSEVNPVDHARLLDERSELLATTWTAPAAVTGASIRTEVRVGDPRNVVLDIAETEDADLVVLGRTGKGGGPGFLHLGSAVEHAAHHIQRPLAVIPSISPGPINQIVVGVDGSTESLRAMQWCAGLATVVDASVIAVSVVEPHLAEVSSSGHERRDTERDIAEWTAPITDTGVEVTPIAQQDVHPADGLLGVASARNCDLLVVGARGAGGFSGVRAGGVAMKVLHKASLPIVLVPPST